MKSIVKNWKNTKRQKNEKQEIYEKLFHEAHGWVKSRYIVLSLMFMVISQRNRVAESSLEDADNWKGIMVFVTLGGRFNAVHSDADCIPNHILYTAAYISLFLSICCYVSVIGVSYHVSGRRMQNNGKTLTVKASQRM